MASDPARVSASTEFNRADGGLRSWLLCLLVLAAIDILLVGWWSLTSDHISRENGPIENLQLAALIAALVVFFRTGAGQAGGQKHFFIAATIACLYLFLRELDLRTLPFGEWVRWLGSDIPRKVTQGLVVLTLIIHVLRHFSAIMSFVKSGGVKLIWPYGVILFLFVAAKMAEEISRADKNKFGDFALPHGQFWEEMLELNADMMILAVALIAYSLKRSISKLPGSQTLS